MQSSQPNLKLNLTAEDIDFIDHAIRVADFHTTNEHNNYLHEDYLPFQHEYKMKSFMNNLRHALTHPTNIDLDDLGEILQKLPATDCITLLDLRPQLLNDIDDLEYIIANYINIKDRLFFTIHHFELIYHADENTCRNNVLSVARLLDKNDYNIFLNFAITWARRENQHNPYNLLQATLEHPHASSFSISYLIAVVSTLNHLLGGNPSITSLTGLIAIAMGLKGLYTVHQETIEPCAYRHFLWNRSPNQTSTPDAKHLVNHHAFLI